MRLFSRTAIICNTFPACATATTKAVSLLGATAYSNRTAEQQQQQQQLAINWQAEPHQGNQHLCEEEPRKQQQLQEQQQQYSGSP